MFQIKKEGESLEFKCRLEEDYEEGEVKMTWHFNDQEIEASERYMITFDGTYATLFIASCVMEDMGEYKVVFENSAGTDETTGKVTVKPVSKKISREKYFLMIKLFSLPNRNLGKTFSNIFVDSQGTHSTTRIGLSH